MDGPPEGAGDSRPRPAERLHADCDVAAYEVVSRVLRENALVFSKPNFEQSVVAECASVLLCLFGASAELTLELAKRWAYDALDRVCAASLWDMPHRSYGETRPSLTLVPKAARGARRGMSRHLQALRAIEQPEQCTPAWYEMRNNLFTASNAWKALFSEASAFSLLREKVDAFLATTGARAPALNVDAPLVDAEATTKQVHVRMYGACASEDSPLSWGKRYEPLSVMHYERRYNTSVQEYGCLVHKDHAFLGASPDGINFKEGSPIQGRMLEIKNVVSRVITGIPKEDYWIQMQLQMEVCDLNECDFLETKFQEFSSYEEYAAEWTRAKESSASDGENPCEFGIIAAFFEGSGHASEPSPVRIHYEYAPLGLTLEEQDAWLEQIQASACTAIPFRTTRTWHRVIYWQLVQSSCVLVFRNRAWFAAAIAPLAEQWERVLYFRERPAEWDALKRMRDAASTRRKPRSSLSSSSSPEEDAPEESRRTCHLLLPSTKKKKADDYKTV